MAEVFKAKAFGVEGFERIVAVKRILPNIAEDKEFITMFVDEAKIAVQLNHANVAQIFDLGKVDDSYFIALEFVHGKDLRAIFDFCRTMGENMPVAQACFITMKVCEGLDYAHNKRDASGRELGLVHRDISPQNVLLSYEGEVKIIDFGIAKAAGKASKTQAGILKGKFGYMSPEQVRGMPLDRRSDIFSLGIVLYELLTGERLFVGESDFSTLEKVRNVEILPPSTYNRKIPDELERIVLKALSKDVEDRYQNAIDLHDELQAFMYSAGEFYSRKDLAAWMKSVFAREIEEETRKLEELQSFPTPARPGVAPAGGPAGGPPPIPVAQPRSEVPYAANPGMDQGYDDPFDPQGGDLDWDDDEIETQLYDREQEIEAQMDHRDPFAGPVGGVESSLPQFSRPQKPMPRRTLMGLGAVSQDFEAPRAEPPKQDNFQAPQYQQPPHQEMPAYQQQHQAPVEAPAYQQPAPQEASAYQQPAAYDQGAAYGGAGQHPPVEAAAQQQGYVSPLDAFGVGAGDVIDELEPLEPLESVVAPERRKSGTGKGLIVFLTLTVLVLLGGMATALWYFVLRSPEKATLTVTAETVPGMKIYLNGEPLEFEPGVPVTVEVEPNIKHKLLAEAPGYEMYEEEFTLKSGARKRLSVDLTTAGRAGPDVATAPTTEKGALKVTTTPPGAVVVLNGQEITDSRTPLQVSELSPGPHKLRIKMPNYLDWPSDGEKEITIEGGRVEDVSATLQPTVVMLIVKSEIRGAGATLYRNNEVVAEGKNLPFTYKLNPEDGVDYRVEVRARNYEPFEKTLAMDGKPEIVVDAEMEQKVAAVSTPPRTEHKRTPTPPRTPRVERKPDPVVTTPRDPKPDDKPVVRPKPKETVAPSGTGTLRINTRPWTRIYVDGVDRGVTPQQSLSLPAGKRRLRLVNKEFNISKTFTVEIRPGQSTTFVRNFE